MKATRPNELYLSSETMFYLKLESKRMVEHTDASITRDAVADGICRKVLTEANPEWVLLWEENQKIRQESKKRYDALEAKALGVGQVSQSEPGSGVLKR